LERDAIYRFEFDTQTVERLYPLEKISRIHTVTYAEGQPFYFSDFDTTYEYDAQKNTLTTLDVPYAEGRPTAAFVDSGGKLWSASSLWYRPPGERVQSFHPRPFLYWWYQVLLDKWRYYIPPSPFTETSDGRIWFETERSSNWKVLRSGMAWFDPSTREGCWFTSETGPLEEDSEGNLWLLIDGALYGNEDAIENIENLE
jgi:hypothetical protein